MKKNVQLLALILGLGMSLSALAQKDNVGIGTTKPDQSAILDLNSSTKGLLMPRMSLQQRSAIQAPAKGLIVYQTDFLSGFYFFDGGAWKPLAETKENSVAGTDGDWTLIGNPTATSANFIGTPTGVPINFKMGSIKAGLIETGNSNTSYGYNGLSSVSTGTFNVSYGAQAGRSLTTGSFNFAIGSSSLQNNTSGSHNTALGTSSLLSNLVGARNVAIGSLSGQTNTGSDNIFIGYSAGQNETGSSKLYIANSNTANPLIKGEFDNKNLKINLGSTKSTTVGFLAVGNFDTAFPMPGSLNSTVNSYRLIVQDGIITEKVKVALKTTADWADYVFEPSYQLMSLDKVEAFVKENKHLPNVPSAEDMSKNGLDVTQTSAKLMEKIEELTLYLIELNKEVKALKVENEKLKLIKAKN